MVAISGALCGPSGQNFKTCWGWASIEKHINGARDRQPLAQFTCIILWNPDSTENNIPHLPQEGSSSTTLRSGGQLQFPKDLKRGSEPSTVFNTPADLGSLHWYSSPIFPTIDSRFASYSTSIQLVGVAALWGHPDLNPKGLGPLFPWLYEILVVAISHSHLCMGHLWIPDLCLFAQIVTLQPYFRMVMSTVSLNIFAGPFN